jgi:D-sedoheptulose 7-phosphate isomerase
LARSSSDLEAWPDYVGTASAALRDLAVTTASGTTLTAADGFRHWIEIAHAGRAQGQRIYFIGNGASAMMASHFAADACKNAGLSAMAFNDASLLTAIGNDVTFDEIFALPLGRLARAGDLVVAISSSGNSPNILRALDQARSMALQIVTLTGKGADNRARARGDLNFYVPADRYGWVECAHQLILHYWLDQYLNLYGGGAL